MNKITRKIHSSIVPVYRFWAAILLWSLLLFVVGYSARVAFYVGSTSWSAPVILAPDSDKVLDLISKVVSTEQMLGSMKLDRDKQTDSLVEMKKQKETLMNVNKDLDVALHAVTMQNKKDGPELAGLDGQKQVNLKKDQVVFQQLDEVKIQVSKDLKNGLITKGDAALILGNITTSTQAFMDSSIAEIVLRDSVREKNSKGLQLMDVLTKRAELIGEIAQLSVQIKAAQDQANLDDEQMKGLELALNAAKATAYYAVEFKNTAIPFAFVPYDNQDKAKVGTPVYDCYLDMVACREVGKVSAVFSAEEHTVHPIFKNDIRGILVELDLTNSESGKSRTLMLGHKPLLF